MTTPSQQLLNLERVIEEQLARTLSLQLIAAVSGGDIHRAYRLRDRLSGEEFFCNTNSSEALAVLQSEAHSLAVLAGNNSLQTPACLACGTYEDGSYLLLEYLPLIQRGDQYLLGQQLARLHQEPLFQNYPQQNQLKQSQLNDEAKRYGFEQNNYIGLTPQLNTWYASWKDFWWECRLRPQLRLAYAKGFTALRELELSLQQASNNLLAQHQPFSSLVHGDLWSGNQGFSHGQPVLFDPACYFGDRETDLAMTELFGGFGTDFYRGYDSVWGLANGYQQRKTLYNLYHLLNHLNLFGAGYLPQVEAQIRGLIQLQR